MVAAVRHERRDPQTDANDVRLGWRGFISEKLKGGCARPDEVTGDVYEKSKLTAGKTSGREWANGTYMRPKNP